MKYYLLTGLEIIAGVYLLLILTRVGRRKRVVNELRHLLQQLEDKQCGSDRAHVIFNKVWEDIRHYNLRTDELGYRSIEDIYNLANRALLIYIERADVEHRKLLVQLEDQTMSERVFGVNTSREDIVNASTVMSSKQKMEELTRALMELTRVRKFIAST